jgi:hypothetical protein
MISNFNYLLRIALEAAPATQTISFEDEKVLEGVRSSAIGVWLEPD